MNFSKNCPICGTIILYKRKQALKTATLRDSKCRNCTDKAYSDKYRGVNASFYGRKHTEESKEKNRQAQSKTLSPRRREESRQVLQQYGNQKHPYLIWVEKYGKEEADQRYRAMKAKISFSTLGKKSERWGKPPHERSGWGWSGWYKGTHFRSLLELSYIVNHLENQTLKWQSAEGVIIIPYINLENSESTYHPDFIIDNRMIIEVKPKRLWKYDYIVAKSNAAKSFCALNNFTYELIDPGKLDTDTMLSLYTNGDIKFIDRIDKKFRKKYMQGL